MDYEHDLLARLEADNPNRAISVLDGSEWGHLILPGADEHPQKNDRGLKVLVIGSWTLGMLAFEAIRELERAEPDRVNIVGLVTDDPLDPDARISLAKRFWRYYGKPRQEAYELDLLEETLAFGVPCYTGAVKNEGFRALLETWAPEAIVVAGFGQLIDTPIIRSPEYGIYNVHPADLRHGFGAGPQPWEDLLARRARTMRVSIHQVSEEIDSGSVVGVSPTINVRLKDDVWTDDVRLIGEKTFMPIKSMVRELVLGLCRNRESGCVGVVSSMDLAAGFSPEQREELLRPIDPLLRGKMLPLNRECSDDSV